MEILRPRLWIIIIGIGIATVYAQQLFRKNYHDISDTEIPKNRRGKGPFITADPGSPSTLFEPVPTSPRPTPIRQVESPRPWCIEPQWQTTKIELNFSHMSMGRFGQNVVKNADVIALNLSHNFIKEIPANSFLHLPLLQVLDLSANLIPVEEILHFQNLGRLEELVLNDNSGTKDEGSLGKTYGTKLPNLKKLHLSGNRISEFTISLREFSPSLTALYLARNKISSTEFLADLPQNLNYLNLDNNNIGRIGSYSFNSLYQLSMNHNELETLCIYECNEDSLTLDTMKRLTDLHLSNNKISRIVFGDFGSSSPRPLHLHVLDLSHNELTEIPRNVFQELRNLRKLKLEYNQFTEVPQFCGLHALQILDLSGNKIQTVSAKSLCDIALQELNLSNNKITVIQPNAFKTGGKALHLDLSSNLLSALPYSWIEEPGALTILRLENNIIADLQAVALNGLVNLQELYITGNPLTHIVLNNLNRMSPNLRLYFNDGKGCPLEVVVEDDDSSSE